ncbi:MAG: AsmA-like C-terminal region-containing protein [Akkermansiaceae bacterium]
MIKIIRVARTTLLLFFGVICLAIVGGLIYLNQVGFPGRYGDRLKSELSDRGVYLSFDTLRFDFQRGLVATDVLFYRDEGKSIPLLEGGEMTLNLDKTKALQGKFKLRSLRITQGTAHIPVDHDGETVTARDINGELKVTETGRIIINDASGLIEGLQIKLSTDLRVSKTIQQEARTPPEDTLKSNHVLSIVLDELALWTIPKEHPPQLAFDIKGDLNYPERLQTSFQLDAVHLKRNQYQLSKLLIEGDLQAQVVTLDKILLEDDNGSASGHADWSMGKNSGRFDLISDLNVQDFLYNCFKIRALKDLKINEIPPFLNLNGSFAAQKNNNFSVSATGRGALQKISFLGTNFDSLTSNFSWKDGDLYLRDLEVIYEGEYLNGNMMKQGEKVQFDLRSSLPLEAFEPLIKTRGSLVEALSRISFSENSTVALDVVGSLNLNNGSDWSANGKVFLSNLAYKGTDIHYVAGNYKIDSANIEFTDVEGLLNDDQEAARLRFNGVASEPIYVDRIIHNPATRDTTIENLRGRAWPTPIVRIFAPTTAKHIEDNYRFHRLPRIDLSGIIAGKKEFLDRNVFSAKLRTAGQTDYPFLGSNLPLQNLIADLRIQGTGITVQNLSGQTLNGGVAGSVFCDVTPGQRVKYRGTVKWDDISFQQLSQVYRFKEEETGSLTGSIDFRGISGGVRGFNADGLVVINQGNLVSLPILGPLSPIIAGILGDKRMGYERAKDASAHFNVTNGVLATNDFIANSTNIELTGEGWIDILTEKLNMTIRVNARGLLGFLTLPLEPLKGIFQFRGTGSYSNPKWQSSPFTRPAKGRNDPIFQKPARAQKVEE